MTKLDRLLRKLGACDEARTWAATQPDLEAAWTNCERGDWMLWLAGNLSGSPDSESRRRLVAAAVDCAALARKHTSGIARKAFDRCQRTTRRYLRAKATIADVRAAADAAYAAYAARARTLKRCAAIVRKHYPTPPEANN